MARAHLLLEVLQGKNREGNYVSLRNLIPSGEVVFFPTGTQVVHAIDDRSPGPVCDKEVERGRVGGLGGMPPLAGSFSSIACTYILSRAVSRGTGLQ